MKPFKLMNKLSANGRFRKIIDFITYFSLPLLVSGCQHNRDELLWSLGCSIFLLFSILVAINIGLPYIHNKPLFQKISEKLKKPAIFAGIAISLLGILVVGIGVVKFFGDFGPEKLTFFLGIVVIILGTNLIYWAKSAIPDKKARHAKLISLCVGFIIALSYVISGAPGIYE
jgi:hypothetical protein